MPDHVHLLVEGLADESNFPKFVALAKQRAAHVARSVNAGKLWQQGYFERILREGDDIFDVARYVVQNPVRAGFVRSPSDYPFLGSEVLTQGQLIGSCSWKPRGGP
jgi:REP element-mobilizing transposase RayT